MSNVLNAQEIGYESIYNIVVDSIIDDLYANITNKTFLFSRNDVIVLKAPVSEKQFVGNIPAGSYANIDDSVVVAVHWNNVTSQNSRHMFDRVDLDLHCADSNSQHYGWYDYANQDKNDVVYSGDLVDAPAPKGATEAFLVREQSKDKDWLFSVNKYTQNDVPVPFDFYIANSRDLEDRPESELRVDCWNNKSSSALTVEPDEVIMKVPFEYDEQEEGKALGIITTVTNNDGGQRRFYFSKDNLSGESRVSTSKFSKEAISALLSSYNNMLDLKELIELCNGRIIYKEDLDQYKKNNDDAEDIKIDYDFSNCSMIEKSKLLELFM